MSTPASAAPAPPLRCPLCGSTMVHPIVAYGKPALECSQCNHWGTLEWGFEQAGARAARRAASPAQEATPPHEELEDYRISQKISGRASRALMESLRAAPTPEFTAGDVGMLRELEGMLLSGDWGEQGNTAHHVSDLADRLERRAAPTPEASAPEPDLFARIERLPVFNHSDGGECVNRTAVLLAVHAERDRLLTHTEGHK